MDVRLRLTGDKAVDNVLRNMPNAMTHRVFQTAHAAAGKITVNAAKMLAPKKSGGLAESIGTVRPSVRNAKEIGQIEIGPRRKKGTYKGHHAHLIEYGTSGKYTFKKRRRGTSSKKRPTKGGMTARPFMEPAWEQTKERVIGSINDQIGRVLNNTMRRYIRNNK